MSIGHVLQVRDYDFSHAKSKEGGFIRLNNSVELFRGACLEAFTTNKYRLTAPCVHIFRKIPMGIVFV